MPSPKFSSHLLAFLALTVLASKVVHNRSLGGRHRRMVNGDQALLEEWPFAAWIHKEPHSGEPLFCGASLISNSWLVTAAHCVHKSLPFTDRVRVGIGSVNRNTLESPLHSYSVSKLIVHPDFNDNDMPNDDIALIKLARPLSLFNSSVQPVVLAWFRTADQNISRLHCKAAGWGKTKTFNSTASLLDPINEPSSNLMEIDMPMTSQTDCIKAFLSINTIPLGRVGDFWAKMMCGGALTPVSGTACYHDSGSPLVCSDPYNPAKLHGIAVGIHGPDILTEPCKPATQLVIFIRVSTYYQWIWKTINDN